MSEPNIESNRFVHDIELWKNWRWFSHRISWEDYKNLYLNAGYIVYTWEI